MSLQAWSQSWTPGTVERGRASYLADVRKGMRTQEGKPYDATALAAAHATLPFGSTVQVTNLDNGKTARLIIHDRPADLKYLLLMTLAAADSLGMIGSIQTDVRVELISLPAPPAPAAPAALPVYSPVENPASTAPVAPQPVAPQPATPASPPVPTAPANALPPSPVSSPAAPMSTVPVRRDWAAVTDAKLASVFEPVGTYRTDGTFATPAGWGALVGSYASVRTAIQVAERLEKLQFANIFVQAGWYNGQKIYRVLLGQFAEKDDAAPVIDFLRSLNYNSVVKPHFKE